MQTMNYPIVGNYLGKTIGPSECYNFWNYYSRGFGTTFRDLCPEDVSIKTEARVREAFSRMLTKKRNRFSIKITGWPRIGYLKEIFNDAKFIHILRDGRAVANSLINVKFWRGWRGPENWGFGELKPSYKQEWAERGKSYVALAGIQWKIIIDAVQLGIEYIDRANFFELKYEHLCLDSVEAFRKIIDFCELEWSTEFEKMISSYHLNIIHNMKWQNELTKKQQMMLEEVIFDYLTKYNYI